MRASRAAALIPRLQDLNGQVAALDVLAALAEVAVRREYVRPEIHDGFGLEIRAGRHPVVETMMPREDFIPNDVKLDESARIMVLTGPNMAGKSTVLRQVGLIQLLAQVGSFVPARVARIGLCDRIFTRVGADDALHAGQSTFMVEMTETANILHNATPRSLVILDEIGRGTATFDGLSIAWACLEHLHEVNRCRALFATHYHELTSLSAKLDSLACHTMRVKEWQGDVVFLHEVTAGAGPESGGKAVGDPLPPVRDLAEELGDALHVFFRHVPRDARLELLLADDERLAAADLDRGSNVEVRCDVQRGVLRAGCGAADRVPARG